MRAAKFSFTSLLATAYLQPPPPVQVWDPILGVLQPPGWIPPPDRQRELRKVERQAATGELRTQLTDRQERRVQHLQGGSGAEPFAFDRLSSSRSSTPQSREMSLRGMSLQSYVPPGASPRRTSMKTVWAELNKPPSHRSDDGVDIKGPPRTPDKPFGVSAGLIPVATLSTPSVKGTDRARPTNIPLYNGSYNDQARRHYSEITKQLLNREAIGEGRARIGDPLGQALRHLSGHLADVYAAGQEALERSDLPPTGDMSPEVASAVINSVAGEASGPIRVSKRQKRK